MAETIIIVALILALLGQGWFLLTRQTKDREAIEAAHDRRLAQSEARVNGLIDRIETPSPAERALILNDPTPAPEQDWRYDQTGLIQVDATDAE